jgi:hypothetical protein
MLRRRVFAVAVAAFLVLGGCSRTVKDAHFRSIELTPVSQAGVETVADLEVISTKKVIGVARGIVTSPEQRHSLYVEAVELAIASDPSGADVLVAPSYFETTEDKQYLTVTVIGYPARYKNFRRSEKSTFFSVKQLPGGVTVISYDKNAFTTNFDNDNFVAIRTASAGGAGSVNTANNVNNANNANNANIANTAPVEPMVPLPAVEETGKTNAPAAKSAATQTGE